MASSNYHYGSTESVSNEVYNFPKPVGHLNVYVENYLSISFDGGENYLTVPTGFSSMTIGPVKSVMVNSNGAFNLVGVQA